MTSHRSTSMNDLGPHTLALVQQVETLSGCPVVFKPDSTLGVQAALQKARNGAAFHVLRYQPGGRALDYWVAYQCAYALRFYALPPDQRWDFSDTGDGTEQVESLLMAGQTLDPNDLMRVPMFARQIEQWALMTLLSYPVGMRIDRWLHHAYPALRVEQAEGMAQLQTENARLLSLAMGRLTVPVSLLGMPAAYARLADSMLGTAVHSTAWQAGGAMGTGERLFDLLEQHADEPVHDRELIDAWGRALGMSGWYRWKPYRMLA